MKYWWGVKKSDREGKMANKRVTFKPVSQSPLNKNPNRNSERGVKNAHLKGSSLRCKRAEGMVAAVKAVGCWRLALPA